MQGTTFEPMSLWQSSRHGLVVCIDAVEVCKTGFGESLFRVHYLKVSDNSRHRILISKVEWAHTMRLLQCQHNDA